MGKSPRFCVLPTVVSLHCLDGELRGLKHTADWRTSGEKRQRSSLEPKKVLCIPFLFYTFPTIGRSQKSECGEQVVLLTECPQGDFRELGTKPTGPGSLPLHPAGGAVCIQLPHSPYSPGGQLAFLAILVNSWYAS